MAKKSPEITHPGTIQHIKGNMIHVRIMAQSACASCHVKGSCTVADMSDKIIEVFEPKPGKYTVGEEVTVAMKQSLGNMAVFFAYFLPFILVLTTLIAVLSYSGNELLAGLISIAILVPYYTGLYLLKDKMGKVFRFELT